MAESSIVAQTSDRERARKIKRGLGVVLSALALVLFMGMSSAVKLAGEPMEIAGFAQSGTPIGWMTAIGVIELLCVIIYLVPATSVLGAILMTGYLGAAMLFHVRVGELALIVPLLLGMSAWGGLYLRRAQRSVG